MDILRISQKHRLPRSAAGIVARMADAGDRARDGAFSGFREALARGVSAMSESVRGMAAKAPAFLKSAAAAALIVAAMSAGMPQISHAAPAEGQQYVLTQEQQEDLFQRVERLDVEDLGRGEISGQEFRHYLTFRALRNPQLEIAINSFGFPNMDMLRDTAQKHKIAGKITPEKMLEAIVRQHDDRKQLLFASMGPEEKKEAIRAAGFEYLDEYNEDVAQRQKSGELNRYQRIIPEIVAKEFVKFGKMKSPAEKARKEEQRQMINGMWAQINAGIKRVYENPKAAACEMSQDVDCLASGQCVAPQAAKGMTPWQPKH